MSTLAQQLFNAGGHYTISSRYRHPSTNAFLSEKTGRRTRVLDVEKTIIEFEKALAFIGDCGEKKKTILFVGTREETAPIVEKTAEALDMPYVVNRWIGGLFTNFVELRKRFQEMKRMNEEKDSGAWERRHTKKEQLLLNRQYKKIQDRFSGVASLTRVPDAVFILDPRKEAVAVKEARDVHVPIIGFTNGNTNLSDLTYKIIANNTTQQSVLYVLGVVQDAYTRRK